MREEIAPIFKALVGEVDKKIREAMLRRYDAMERELKYLADKEDRNLSFIRSRRWSEERLLVLFILNSFYQQIVGPLQSSARGGIAKLGTVVPIKHGTTIYGTARSSKVNSAANDFFKLVSSLKYERKWMTKNTAGEIVFSISEHERELSGGRSGD